MGLQGDQRALLQLLSERGQSYEDIGSLLGLDVEEVRTRARSALTEMGGEDPDREVGLTDYLLGQADPIGRADAARHVQADPGANALAHKLVAQLRLLARGRSFPCCRARRVRPRPPQRRLHRRRDRRRPHRRPSPARRRAAASRHPSAG